jgi:sigma-B regulation protein RsbU (phosphoserine phosphatase)
VASLEIRCGGTATRQQNLRGAETTIGRLADSDVVILHETASRRHARIFSEDGCHYLEDLGSSLGTYLNGQRIRARSQLQEGDGFRVADTDLVFHAGSALPEEDPDATILSALDGRAPIDASGAADPREKLRAVLDLTASLGATLDLDELFPKILQSAFRIFPQAARGSVWLVGAEGELEPRAALDSRGATCTTPPLSRTIAERVIQGGEAVLSADTRSDERFDASASVLVHGIRSVMCAPLIAASRKSGGMLQLDSNSIVQPFNEEDLDVLVNVANLAGQVVEHAQLHESRMRYERRERDLSLARTVQAHFLPETPPELPGYRLAHHYEPALSVGGDYFDYIALPDGRMALALGDVAGKGVSAALLMARLCSDVRSLLLSSATPVEAVNALNRSISKHAIFGRFVTLALCVLDPGSGEACVVNAGHLPPLHRSGGQVSPLGDEATGPPLGVVEDSTYAQTSVSLAPGDALLFFTDGVPEAMSPDGAMLGDDAAEAALVQAAPADEIVAALLRWVTAHTAGAPANDDLCTIAISRDAR